MSGLIECKLENCFMCGEEDKLCYKAYHRGHLEADQYNITRAEKMAKESYLDGVKSGRADAIDEFLKKITNISYVADVGTAYQRVVVNLEYAEAIAERMKGEQE